MPWEQSYVIGGHGLGVSAMVAALPILLVLLLLGVLGKPAWLAGLCGLAGSLLVALLFYRMPVKLAAGAMTYGAAFGLFPVTWIVFGAIMLYRITEHTGKFDVIRHSISRLTGDATMQALLIAFGFEAFLEGAAGFGTPVAIAAAMLTGLGFSPMRASAICLLANTAPVAFGSIGIPLVTLAGTTGLPLARLSSSVGALCAPLAFIMPAYMLAALGSWKLLRSALAPALMTGAVFALTQYGVAASLGPQLADILASLLAMGVLFLLCRGKTENAALSTGHAFHDFESLPAASPESFVLAPELTPRMILAAWLPYGLLVFFVLLWAFRPVQQILERATVDIAWPWLHDRVVRTAPIVSSPQPYHALFVLNALSAAGTACMAAWLSTAAFCRLSVRELLGILRAVCRQLVAPTATITVVLAMAFLMNYSGATATLGLAFSSTGASFPFFSAMLGWLGVFLTGSDTSANALFGNLQVVTAARLHLQPVLMAAANSSGGVMGKMISLQTIAIAAAATGLTTAEQSKLFRLTLKHSALLAAVVGSLVLLYVRLAH